MTSGSQEYATRLEQLSAVADGEADAAQVSASCAGWRDDTELRMRWHSYHLIGDVLRSDDLAVPAAGDAAFLAALRTRLAAEPVVLAPAPLPSRARTRRARWGWAAPAAVAAGFAAVAGAVLVLQSPDVVPTPAPTLVQAVPPGVVPAATASLAAAGEPPVIAANPTLIRDARLDRYLDAHKQFAGSSALGAPSGYLRAGTGDTGGR